VSRSDLPLPPGKYEEDPCLGSAAYEQTTELETCSNPYKHEGCTEENSKQGVPLEPGFRQVFPERKLVISGPYYISDIYKDNVYDRWAYEPLAAESELFGEKNEGEPFRSGCSTDLVPCSWTNERGPVSCVTVP
jgi:hypothetical protein